MNSFEETLGLRPSHAAAWGKKGDLLRERGELDAAIAAYRQAIRFQPDTRRNRLALGIALRETGDFVGASESFVEVLRLRPQHESALHGWAQSVLDEARLRGVAPRASLADSMVERLSSYTREHGGDFRHRALLAQLHWQRGEDAEALSQFRRLSEGDLRPSFFARAAALLALELGLWNEARERFDALRGDDGRLARRQLELCELGRSLSSAMEDSSQSNDAVGRANALAVRARGLLETLDPELSFGGSPPLRIDFERRLEDVESVPESLEFWARAYLARHDGDEEQERVALDSLARRHPDFEPQLRRLFRAAIARGDLDAAEAAGRNIRVLAPRDREVLAGLSEAALNGGRLQPARRALARMTQADRENPSVRRLEGRLLLEEGRPQDAIRVLEAAARGATPELEMQRLLADAYFAAKRDNEAVRLLTSILIRDPGRLETRERLARALMDLRRYREAIQEWRRVLGLSGENGSSLFNLALCLQRDRRHDEAIGIYDRVLRLDPALYRAHYNRALALERLGRKDEAISGFHRVLELKPGHEGSLQHLVDLQSTNEEN